MVDKTIPALDPVVTVAPTDRFGVRQAGDAEDKRETRAQVHALVDGEYLVNSFTNNITANPGGGQGGATGLTSEINFVTTCEDAGDGVRMPATFPVGAVVEIHVRGTTDHPDLYPASGDDLGLGVDTPIRLEPNQLVRYIATVADSTWERLFQELIQSEAINGALIEPDVGGAVNSPSLIPDKRDTNTGVSANGDDVLYLVAGGLNLATFSEVSGGIIQQWEIDETVTANPGGGQGSAVALRSTYNEIDVVATDGDSIALPATFQPGATIYIINTGAAACDVFPASGDDLGEGVDTALFLQAGAHVSFIGTSANSTWEQLTGAPNVVFGADGKLFINTITGVGAQGSNVVSATPANVEIYAAQSATNGVNGGDVELWGGYAAGNAPARGGDVILWGGGAGGSEPTAGDVLLIGGAADIFPGDVILTGGLATVGGGGGLVRLLGGDGFGTNFPGGRAEVFGGEGIGTGAGGQTVVRSGDSGSGATGIGGNLTLSSGDSSATDGAGGITRLESGQGAGTGNGGLIAITAGFSQGGTGDGGAVTINAGSATSGDGGPLTISSGESLSSGSGGIASYESGDGTFNGSGGALNITAGDSGSSGTGGAGGAIGITAGAALGTNGDGGDLNLTAGAGNGSGTDGVINFTGNVAGFSFNANLLAATATGPAILDEAASAANPTLIPVRNDLTTGIGGAGLTSLSMIAGGVEGIRLVHAGGSILQQHESNVALTADAGSSQGDGVITSSYNVYSVVGTAGDAATLPAVFVIGSVVYVKNDDSTESMDVFPALGDDAGAGTNTAVAVLAGDFAVFLGTAANSTWTKIMGGAA